MRLVPGWVAQTPQAGLGFSPYVKARQTQHGDTMTITPETFDRICEQLAEGQSLRAICREPGMPSVWTVLRYVDASPEASQQYARARELQAEFFAQDIVDISDDATNDYMKTVDADGVVGYKLNGENIARSKLRVDSRKWIASRILPKKYGDKTLVGSDPDNPLPQAFVKIERIIVKADNGEPTDQDG
jgi:hypothetical protein